MFVTGPDVIKSVTHEEVTKEELGGANTHNEKSGVAHFAAEDDKHCLLLIREILSFLPSNNLEDPTITPTLDSPDRIEESLNTLVPENPKKPYDMKQIISKSSDEGYFLEVQQHYAKKYNHWFCSVQWAKRWYCCQSTHCFSRLPKHRSQYQSCSFYSFL